ncbi:MAG: DNA alkylation repair protein [Clostridia bacterium]|nr:DNA alkylation repair protein [Clostridia bacterium]
MKYDKQLNEKIETNIDAKYALFHSKIVPDSTIRGVRIPVLRQIAKEFSKYDDFLENITLNDYENISVACYYIGNTTKDLPTLNKRLHFILPYIDNWAICDTFVSSLKILKKNKDAYPIIFDKLNNQHIYIIRFGIVALMNYFLDNSTVGEIFAQIIKLQSIDYYIDMAIAWLVSVAFIKCRKQALDLLTSGNLTHFVQNESISKICDSLRVTQEDKSLVKSLKKK